MYRLLMLKISMAVSIIVLLGSAVGITVSSLYAFSDDRTLSSDQNSNVAAPGWINVTKQRTDEVIRQSSGNKNKVEATMERADDKLSDKVAEDQADKPKAELKKKSGGSDSSRAGSDTVQKNSAGSANEPVDLGEAGAILYYNVIQDGEGYINLANGKTMYAEKDENGNPYFWVTDNSGNILIGKQAFTYSGTLAWSESPLYATWREGFDSFRDEYRDLVDSARAEAFDMFYNNYMDYLQNPSLFSPAAPYSSDYTITDEDMTNATQFAATLADSYILDFCNNVGSVYGYAGMQSREGYYTISDISISGDGKFDVSVTKDYRSNWGAGDILSLAADTYNAKFKECWNDPNTTRSFINSFNSGYSINYLTKYHTTSSALWSSTNNYWFNFYRNYSGPAYTQDNAPAWALSAPSSLYLLSAPTGSGSSAFSGIWAQAYVLASQVTNLEVDYTAKQQAMPYAMSKTIKDVMNSTGFANYSTAESLSQTNMYWETNAAMYWEEFGTPQKLNPYYNEDTSPIVVFAKDNLFLASMNTQMPYSAVHSDNLRMDFKIDFLDGGFNIYNSEGRQINSALTVSVFKGLSENKGILVSKDTGNIDEAILSRVVDMAMLVAAVALPAEYVKETGGDEMKLAAALAAIFKNPTEDQRILLDIAQAVLSDAAKAGQGAESVELEKVTNELIQTVVSIMLAQAIPGLLKEGDIANIKAVFKELESDRIKIVKTYHEAVKPYYEKLKGIFIKNLSALQLSGIFSKNMAQKEIEDMPAGDIDKILEKLKNAKDKTFEQEYILQEEAKCRKQYLDPGKKELADRMKQMLDRFTSRIGGVINTGEGKK